MTSMAMDLAAPAAGLLQTQTHAFKSQMSPEQRRFVSFMAAHPELEHLKGFDVLLSNDRSALNRFQRMHGFPARFGPGLAYGLTSAFRMDVPLPRSASVTWLDLGIPELYQEFPALTLPTTDAAVYAVAGSRRPVVRLVLPDWGSIWLSTIPGQTGSALDLAAAAQTLTASKMTDISGRYERIVLPMLELNLNPDLGWLQGFEFYVEQPDPIRIDMAFQRFHLQVGSTGLPAAASVPPAATPTRGSPWSGVFNKPFIGWFTRQEHDDLAIAAFYADYDAWRRRAAGTPAPPQTRPRQ